MKEITQKALIRMIPYLIIVAGMIIDSYASEYNFYIGFITGVLFSHAYEIIDKLLKEVNRRMEIL